MNVLLKSTIGSVLCLAVWAGCNKSTTDSLSRSPDNALLLAAEPAGAIDVMNVRAEAQDGQPVVVLGRIGGGAKPWIDGRAAFLLTDERIVPSCSDECDAGCTQCAVEVAEATTMVKFLDAQGAVLNVDARELLGVKDQQIVVIRGVASRDDAGNVSIAANGIYVR